MTESPVPHPSEPLPVRELFSLFRQLSQVTDEAFEALEEGEIERLARCMDRRDEILAATAPLLRKVRRLRQRGGSEIDGELAAVLPAMERVGSALHAQMQHLLAGLSSHRAAVLTELTQLNRAYSAQQAYSRPAPSPPAR